MKFLGTNDEEVGSCRGLDLYCYDVCHFGHMFI